MLIIKDILPGGDRQGHFKLIITVSQLAVRAEPLMEVAPPHKDACLSPQNVFFEMLINLGDFILQIIRE